MKQLELFDELPPVTVRVFAHTSSEALRTQCIAKGLSGNALDFACHFFEVALDVQFNPITGELVKCEVII